MKKTLILTLLLTFAAAGTANAADPNLLAWWKLDEGTGNMAYDSAGTNHGILTGNAQWVAGKISNYALYFDGNNDNVDAPLNTASNPITYSFWFKPSIVNGENRIIERNWSSGGSFTSGALAGKMVAIFRQSNGISGPTLYSAPVSVDTWYHAVCVFDGAKVSLYMDGVLVDSKPQTSIKADTNHIYIGAINYDYKGTIDDVRVYDQALSAEEAMQLYQDSFPKGVELAIMKINAAIDEKIKALEIIDSALEKENQAITALNEILQTKEYGDLQKGDIIKAIAKTHSAIQHEEQSQKDLEKNIEKLEDALGALGIEPLPPLDPNLVAWWKLDETSGTIAHDSAGNNSGTLYGNPVWTSGIIGSALSFDGAGDYISCGQDSSLNITKAITLSAWVYTKSDNNAQIINRHGFGIGNYGWMLARFASSDSFEWRISTTGSDWNGGTTSSNNFGLNQWIHVAATYNGSVMRVYLNGVENTAGSFPVSLSGDIKIIPVPPLIGSDTAQTKYFNGTIDDVRIYNRALTETEVAQIYSEGL